jgi:hypothetical protein
METGTWDGDCNMSAVVCNVLLAPPLFCINSNEHCMSTRRLRAAGEKLYTCDVQ